MDSPKVTSCKPRQNLMVNMPKTPLEERPDMKQPMEPQADS
eukprot:CAMPEP_0185574554 /NCGR_PEP_ID=MMETSP0434-20130131/5996_1 /TAXON_ID=626734 ORGANISM="Favella taraikaensis, Strain Fe Narragansett Bay" /NCGR_SAMPLE_ID=MMETSP0434 /ASSEMBLY_ACC=CAM_ASM_000379 /LENGTH=40 /DNA_ID= /DNA_START= /DNA_END= /DNA_ORIENTATION=